MRGLSAFADRPDDKRLNAQPVAARKDFVERALVGAHVGGDVAALIESDAELLDHAVVNRRDEAHGEENEIGLELELRAGDRLHLASTFTHLSFLTSPFSPTNSRVSTAKSRAAPSSCDDEARNFSGQSGQVRSLFSFSGGC